MTIHKVSRVLRKGYSKFGHTLFSMLLDDKIWVNNVNPFYRYSAGRGRKSVCLNKGLASFCEEHNGLEALAGKYIDCSITKDKEWNNINQVFCIDIRKRIVEQLAMFTGKLQRVPSEIPFYDFLILAGYSPNEDGSISSKKGSNIRIIQVNDKDYIYNTHDKEIEPYLPSKRTDILTVYNVNKVYEEFYRGRGRAEGKNYNERESATRTEIDLIIENNPALSDGHNWYHTYECYQDYGIYLRSHKHTNSMKMHVKERILVDEETYVLRLGANLSKSQAEYLETL